MRSLVARLFGNNIAVAASKLCVSTASVRRWRIKGAPAKQEWRLKDAREQAALAEATRKAGERAIEVHLQEALKLGRLPERVVDAEYNVKSQRRIGRRFVKTWPWPVLDERLARRIIRWFCDGLKGAQQDLWQAVIGYAQLGWLPGEEYSGYRGGQQISAVPEYSGKELEEDVTVEAYWNSKICQSRGELLAEIRAWVSTVLRGRRTGVIVRIDVTELRNFEWRLYGS